MKKWHDWKEVDWLYFKIWFAHWHFYIGSFFQQGCLFGMQTSGADSCHWAATRIWPWTASHKFWNYACVGYGDLPVFGYGRVNPNPFEFDLGFCSHRPQPPPQSHQLRRCGREGTLFNHLFAEAAPAARPPSSQEFPAWMWRLLPSVNACRLTNITVHSTSGRVRAKKCGEKKINLRGLRNLRRWGERVSSRDAVLQFL